jgi:hypothetical protein
MEMIKIFGFRDAQKRNNSEEVEEKETREGVESSRSGVHLVVATVITSPRSLFIASIFLAVSSVCNGCSVDLCSIIPPASATGFPCYQGTTSDTTKCFLTDPLLQGIGWIKETA